MTIEQICKYIFHTPENTNKAILVEMLQQLIISHGGSLDGGSIAPEGTYIIYDGGIEE